MAKVYLDTANSGFVAANNRAELLGSSGQQSVYVNSGVTGLEVANTIEDIDFANVISAYQFRREPFSTLVEVLDGSGSVLAKVSAANQTLSFADGTAQLSSAFDSVTGAIVYLGGAEIGEIASELVPTTFDTSDVSSNSNAPANSGSNQTKTYLGQGDSRYVIANNDIAVDSVAGHQTLVINEGVTGISVPSTVEDIDFIGAISDFEFRQVGSSTALEVLNGNGVVVADITAVNQTLSFTDGTARLGVSFANGALSLDLGGSAVTQTASSITPLNFDTTDVSVANAKVIIGTNGDDTLNGTSGNDIIRGGRGVDVMDGGAGDDVFIVVGDVSSGGKVDTVEDTQALGFDISTLNFQNPNEDEDGSAETIIGGDGEDTLYVIGTADISNYDIQGIEHVEIRSDVSFNEGAFSGTGAIQTINGDGSSILRVTASDPSSMTMIDLSNMTTAQLSGINQIDVGDNVMLVIDSLDQLGDANVLTGTGTIRAKNADSDFALTSRYSVQSTLNLVNSDGSDADTSSAVVIDKVDTISATGVIGGTDDDEYLVGTAADDVFYTGNGNDIMSGLNGNDVFYINGEGVKVIVDSDEPTSIDRVDFSALPQGVEFDLNTGGQSGNTSVSLGLANAGGANSGTAFNLLLILDSSGSMSGLNIQEAKTAALDLIAAYENLGDVAVRLIDFDDYAESDVGGLDVWLDSITAKDIIADPNNFYASGGTDYRDALEQAILAFNDGQNQTYYPLATNVSYFLSDGNPNWGGEVTPTLQSEWEQFLIDNQVIASAIGFDGISNTFELEPVAFDATRVVDSNGDGVIDINDDLTAAQISPVIEVDTTNLADTVVNQARLDFLENATGTDYNDVFTGNRLNNNIDGGAGYDKVNLSGARGDYSITSAYDTVTVTDLVSDRDGTNTFQNIEELVFTDSSTQLQYSLPTIDAVTQNYLSDGIGNSLEGAFFELLSDLNIASYYHEPTLAALPGMAQPSSIAQNNPQYDFVAQSYERLKEHALRFVDTAELGIAATGTAATGQNYAYDNGFYVAYDTVNTDQVASAMVARTEETLTVTFRGDESSNSWFTDSANLEDLFTPLLEQIQDFAESPGHGIERVILTGHSLSADMALEWLNNQAAHLTTVEQFAMSQDGLNSLYFERFIGTTSGNVVHALKPTSSTLVADDFATDIVKLGETTTVVGDITLDASAASTSKLLMGNNDDNVIVASDHGDLLVGDLGLDKLLGGQGADVLFGGSVPTLAGLTTLMSEIELDHSNLSGQLFEMYESLRGTDLATHSSVAISDGMASYLYGGAGSDIIIGNAGTDYVFVDVDFGSTAYLDSVYEFTASGLNQDRLVFSQSDLGVSDAVLSSIVSTTAVDVNGFQGFTLATDNFVSLNGIDQYQNPTTSSSSEPLFVMDYAAGQLYIDIDGRQGALSPSLVANVYGADVDADKVSGNQIVILGASDFDMAVDFA